MDKVLVTGATGFIGNVLVRQLLAKGCHVRILARNASASMLGQSNVEMHIGDLTNKESLKNICKDIDTVFHLGGYSHALEDTDKIAYENNWNINFYGTQHLFAEAIQSKVKKFIYFSSVKAAAESSEWLDETWTRLPNNAYGQAKRKAEDLILELGKTNNMHTCIIRPSLVYGLQWKGNLEKMLAAIDKNYFLPPPEANNLRSMVSVNDLCRAAILSADSRVANGKIYIITDSRGYSTRELYELMCHSLGKKIPKWHMPLFGFKMLALAGDIFQKITKKKFIFDSYAMEKLFTNARYKNDLIKNELNFIPKETLESCLPQIIAEYKNLSI